MRDITDFDSIAINIASPEIIKAMSYGEVKKPETINYRTLRPEKDGLFCERIFGTTKEWECYCGKFKSMRYKGVICDRCGVEVTSFRVRRERMGHIDLVSPVAHIWFYRTVPSRIGLFLDLAVTSLKSILYFEKYIVIDPGDTDLKKNQILSEDEYFELRERYGLAFQAETGAEAVRLLLEAVDIKKEIENLRAIMLEKGEKSDKRLLKRIEILEDFYYSKNNPEWMMLDVVPVIPPDLRPMVQLDGGRFATSDLNDLYRRVINRNNRLKRLLELNAPEIIVRNEKRMLQEAVDALFDNSKKRRVVKGSSARPLKSLSDLLKGKQGRFRQNLLGKRVDYSGRSVIVVGPTLKLHECGLPVKMALELFKPFVMHKLVEKEIVFNIKKAKQMIEQEYVEVFKILEEVVAEHPVLLNRAPTLHRLGIQAFSPVLVGGKAIQLHPLVCKAFNADFDGDQMAVHVPLSIEAQMECWMLMLSSKNLLDPANGKPIVGPSQDMVLGINYLTRIQEGVKGENKVFKDVNEVLKAVDTGTIHLQAKMKVFIDGKFIETTPGRVILNESFPKGVEYVNEALNEKRISFIISRIFKEKGAAITVKILDAIKEIGFKYAMIFGATIGMDDIIVPENKKDIIQEAQKKADVLYQEYRDGIISSDERYNKIQDIWTRASHEISDSLFETLKNHKKGFNPIYMMADSGARGSSTQIRQLAGMRGLMTKPNGEIIELPIKSNFKEGLSVIEFYISTNGARKGLADTALKTADAGYLTRRLVDIAQDAVVNEEDCGTINGIEMSALKEGDKIIESLRDRITGRFAAEDIRDPMSGRVIIKANELITDEVADEIDSLIIETVRIRTVLTCESKRGVCVRCYGRNLAENRSVSIGEAIGIIAAQSIGQPGTQLTMRTFHIGGAVTGAAQENSLKYDYDVLIEDLQGSIIVLKNKNTLFARKGYLYLSRINHEFNIKDCKVKIKNEEKVIVGKKLFVDKKGEEIISQEVGYAKIFGNKLYITTQVQEVVVDPGSLMYKKVGDIVKAKEMILIFDPFVQPIISEKSGKAKFVDLKIGITIKEEIDETTGTRKHKVSESFLETLQPRILILDKKDKEIASYILPGGSYLNIRDGQEIEAGDSIAKIIQKKAAKATDITGGLPRVAELFEARKPRNSAVLAKISGVVKFEGKIKGKDIIVVEDAFGNKFRHVVAAGAYLLVREGDLIRAGDKISEGSINPHDILQILGENALQRFMMNEIQSVYRLQGVNLNDKHIGVILRQMMKKVEIIDVGDTHFILGQQIDKWQFYETNKKVIKEGGQPAIGKPILLGITKASLSIDSFISAASFQETTRVLTNAAIKGMTDNLNGLKENVIIGHLIPAGTGMNVYKNIKLYDENMEDLDVSLSKIMEEKNKLMGENAITDIDKANLGHIGK
ncbi:MAG: DNA-directed RNA polymerase subunit beta' [Fusobacteriaceae bacterium]|nr:DNA-directed RNA polymerase subunit beta' [Fusobacteriaceae bacterium]